MKRIFSILLCALLMAGALTLAACKKPTPEATAGRVAPGPASEGLKFELVSGMMGQHYIVAGMGTCTDTHVIIPDTYNGLPVRGIAAGAFRPTALGGTACEKTALEVADAMTYLMARCQVGPIRYDGQMGLFTVRVLVTWTRTTFSIVRVDGEQVAQVVDFSATRKQVRLPYVTEDGQQTQVTVGGIQWTVTVVDELPRDEMAENDKTGAFTLTVEREGGSETYPGCVWTQVTLEDRKNAIRRTRVAESNQERTVAVQ